MKKLVIRTKEDVETFDFIITVLNAYSNCDSWGDCDMEEKHEQCDKALKFMYDNIVIKKS